MIEDIRAARDAAFDKIAAAAGVDDIVRLDQELLGKRGSLAALKSLARRPVGARRAQGRGAGAQ